MSKMAQFLCFLLMTAKNQSQFGQNTYTHLNDLTEFFQKTVWLIGFEITICNILTVEI